MPKKLLHISLSLGLVLILAILAGQTSQAVTTAELQAKIATSNQNRDALLKEIANYQKQLDVVDSQASTLQSAIKSLDLSTAKITTEVKLTQNNIDETTLSITDTGQAIDSKEQQINKDGAIITETLRQINQADSNTTLEILLQTNNLSDFWNDVESTTQLQTKINDQIIQIKLVKTDLENTKTSLERKKKDLEQYNRQLNDQKSILQSTKKEKSALLAATKNTQANYNKILADKKALMNALDQEISQYESQLNLVINPKSYPPAGKGILAWPLDTVKITQTFGYTVFAKTAYASGYHNGVDFAASIGTRIKSAGNGVVDEVGDTDIVCPGASFGKWVFIRYDNGLASIYGHLSLITAKPGQRVSTGDVVGYSGNTGYTTGPHLHMSVYAGQGVKVSTLKSAVCRGTYTMPIADTKAYLDPLVYL